MDHLIEALRQEVEVCVRIERYAKKLNLRGLALEAQGRRLVINHEILTVTLRAEAKAKNALKHALTCERGCVPVTAA